MLNNQIELSGFITIGPALDESGLSELKDNGFKTIINLSKKGELEQPLEPLNEEAIVKELEMSYVHFPVSVSNIKAKHVDEFIEGADKITGPVYIHCLLGQRSTTLGLILHAVKKKLSPEKILSKAEKLGVSWNAPFLRDFVSRNVDRLMKKPA